MSINADALHNDTKLVAIKKISNIFDEGDIIYVIKVSEEGIVSFRWGSNFEYLGMMTITECNEYFKEYDEKKKNDSPRIKPERINWIMEHSEINIQTMFDKCTVVTCKCPNGFVITESSACVSPDNYDEDTGVDICLNKIEDKLWELEGYMLQEILSHNCCENCDECDECDCDDDYAFDENDDEEEPDCDKCEDYECPSNPNSPNRYYFS